MSLLLSVVLVVLGVAFAFWIYFIRELPVRGRGLLAGVRAVILALILLLLWNPSIPGGATPDDSGAEIILLDGSLSMTARDTSGTSVWQLALDRLREQASDDAEPGAHRLLLFGRGFRTFDGSSPADIAGRLADETPAFVASELAPALERAAEAGARTVTIISDFRLHDAVAARDVADRLGLDLRIVRTGEVLRNAGISDFTIPAGVEAGDSLRVEVVLFGEAPADGDSLALEIHEGDRRVAVRTLPLPAAGRLTRIALTLPSPGGTGVVEYRASVRLEEDGFELDDERIAHVTVDPDEGGIVLLSWRPDWEPRFLLPVLEQVTGLSGHGYLRTGDGRYLAMGAGPSAGGTIDEAALRRRMARADLLVLHGVEAGVPAWLRELAEGASRLLLFPRDREGAAVGGVQTGDALSGEWYAGADIPASPLAAALTGTEWTSLPPLARLLPLANDEAGIVPLELQLQGRGAAVPALVLHSEGARRRVVVLASGLWRWSFRRGPPRQGYRGLWSGVSGWLLGNEPLAGGPGVRPESSILPRGGEIPWRAPGLDGESLAVRVVREGATEGPDEVGASEAAVSVPPDDDALQDGAVVTDTIVRVGENGSFRTPSPPPGRYRYIVNGEGAEGEAPESEGRPRRGAGVFQVESYSDELSIAPRDFATLATEQPAPASPGTLDATAPAGAATGAALDETTDEASGAGPESEPERDRGTRPLRTHPAPFLLLLLLLCGEWIGRRGKGLR
ncbi:MAG: hypothetical protein WDZ89_02220 [Gemmatimonadota bacterium]